MHFKMIEPYGDVPRIPRIEREDPPRENNAPWIVVVILCVCVLTAQAIYHRHDTARAIVKARVEGAKMEHSRMVDSIKHFKKVDGFRVVWYQVGE